MGTQVQYGSIAVGAYYAHLRGTHQPAFRDQYTPRWDRSLSYSTRTKRDPQRYFSKWSFGCKMGFGDVSGADGSQCQGMTLQDWFAPPVMDDGANSLKFIKGLCVDASDVAIPGATVQAFRTSDDTFAGFETQSRQDGSYDLGTNFAGVAHYVVAYIAGSPDRGGTTVNTLVPANIDGT